MGEPSSRQHRGGQRRKQCRARADEHRACEQRNGYARGIGEQQVASERHQDPDRHDAPKSPSCQQERHKRAERSHRQDGERKTHCSPAHRGMEPFLECQDAHAETAKCAACSNILRQCRPKQHGTRASAQSHHRLFYDSNFRHFLFAFMKPAGATLPPSQRYKLGCLNRRRACPLIAHQQTRPCLRRKTGHVVHPCPASSCTGQAIDCMTSMLCPSGSAITA